MHEAGEAEHKVEADGDCIELPALRKGIPDRGFDRVGDADHQKVQNKQLEYANKRRLGRLFRTKETEYRFAEIREVRAKSHERDDHPTGGGGIHSVSEVRTRALAS